MVRSPAKRWVPQCSSPENNGKGGTITLLRPTASGKTYMIVERADPGTHTFSTQNAEIKDASGNPVGATFQAN